MKLSKKKRHDMINVITGATIDAIIEYMPDYIEFVNKQAQEGL